VVQLILEMNYILILWVCSSITTTCLSPPIYQTLPYKTHYECVKAGYINSFKMVETMGKAIIEREKLFVAFNCRPEATI
jgi:hypothetical protein